MTAANWDSSVWPGFPVFEALVHCRNSVVHASPQCESRSFAQRRRVQAVIARVAAGREASVYTTLTRFPTGVRARVAFADHQ
jgi:hypothetical protein